MEELRKYPDNKMRQTTEFWQEDLECLDVSVGEMLEKEDDRYLILSAKDTDSLGTPCQKRLLKYMSVRDGNVGIFWDMQVREDLQDEDMVSAMIHGVYMQIAGGYTDSAIDIQEELREEADQEEKLYSDQELGKRNSRASEVMPLQGQEPGAFYTLEYESQNYGSEEYYKCAKITWVIEVKENYLAAFRISLMSMDYDNNTNSLIKELETAYGFDLSKWYAKQ